MKKKLVTKWRGCFWETKLVEVDEIEDKKCELRISLRTDHGKTVIVIKKSDSKKTKERAKI